MIWSRLLFLACLGCSSVLALAVPARAADLDPNLEIITVAGPVPAGSLGPALAHEHVMSIFSAPATADPEYDESALRAAVLPALHALRADGVAAVFECTADYFGRDVVRLREFSRETGLHIITNTGYYGASEGRYLPPGLDALDVETIAAGWIAEAREGIAGTGIRPGFIKLGVNAGPLREVDRQLLAAAARTHLATGLTLAVHTGDNPGAAAAQLELFREAGVAPRAWIWVHAHLVNSTQALLAAGHAGAWLSLDGWTPANTPRLLERLQALKTAGLLGRVLISHDGNLFPALGRAPRPMNYLFTAGRERLLDAGFTAEEWHRLTVLNPAAAFAVRVRTP